MSTEDFISQMFSQIDENEDGTIDEDGLAASRIDADSVYAAPVQEERDRAELLNAVTRHEERTGSPRAKELLADWDRNAARFIKISPKGSAAH